MKTQSTNMGTMSLLQPENWLYEIWQKGYESPCYVMVPNAKDLVKSHLMIAVREEVEVLKEKISELMDKINQLEVENTILKANMPTETLHQLQMQTQLQITGGVGSAKMIAAPPIQMQQPQQIQQQPQMQQLQQQQQIIPQQQQIIQQQQAPQAFVANPAANFTTGRMS